MRLGLSERNSRPFPTLLSRTAGRAWGAAQAINHLLPEGELLSPARAPGWSQKTSERSSPPLGIPFNLVTVCSPYKNGQRP